MHQAYKHSTSSVKNIKGLVSHALTEALNDSNNHLPPVILLIEIGLDMMTVA